MTQGLSFVSDLSEYFSSSMFLLLSDGCIDLCSVHDEELGHYMSEFALTSFTIPQSPVLNQAPTPSYLIIVEVPPRMMFLAQTVATVVASFVVIGVQDWMFGNIEGLCSINQSGMLAIFFSFSSTYPLSS